MSLIDTGQLNKKDIKRLIDRSEYFKKILNEFKVCFVQSMFD